jgi:hypothetical protein
MKAVEESGLSVWIRDSPSIFAYWFILSFHALGMGMAVGASVVIDFRILGVARDLPLSPLKGLYRIIWAGFWIQVVSGILLLIAYPTKALTNPDFYIKLMLIGFAIAVMKMIQKRVFSDSSLTEPAMMLKGRSSRSGRWFYGLELSPRAVCWPIRSHSSTTAGENSTSMYSAHYHLL